MIPFLQLTPGDDAAAVREAIDRVITRGWFVLGPELDAFEREFAAAMRRAERGRRWHWHRRARDRAAGLGIGPGDEVITTPLSAAYSALAIMMAGPVRSSPISIRTG